MSKTIASVSLEFWERFYIGLLEEQGFMNLNDYFVNHQTDHIYYKLDEFELYESNKIETRFNVNKRYLEYEVNIIPPKYIHEINNYFDNINSLTVTL